MWRWRTLSSADGRWRRFPCARTRVNTHTHTQNSRNGASCNRIWGGSRLIGHMGERRGQQRHGSAIASHVSQQRRQITRRRQMTKPRHVLHNQQTNNRAEATLSPLSLIFILQRISSILPIIKTTIHKADFSQPSIWLAGRIEWQMEIIILSLSRMCSETRTRHAAGASVGPEDDTNDCSTRYLMLNMKCYYCKEVWLWHTSTLLCHDIDSERASERITWLHRCVAAPPSSLLLWIHLSSHTQTHTLKGTVQPEMIIAIIQICCSDLPHD